MTTPRWRVLVAGCGYLGSAVARHLASEGHTVIGARRRPEPITDGVKTVAVDFATGSGLTDLPRGIDAVVWSVSPDRADERAYRTAYVDGPRRLLEFLADRDDDVQRVAFASSTAVFGSTNGEWVDEDTPAEPADFRGRIVLAGERALDATGLDTVALRFGGIYGPGRTRSIERVQGGLERPPAAPQWTNRVHRDDGAAIVAHVLALEAPDELYIAVDDEPADRREVLTWLARRLGVALPPPSDAPPTRGSKRCRNLRLRATGYEFRFPTWRDGLADALPAHTSVEDPT